MASTHYKYSRKNSKGLTQVTFSSNKHPNSGVVFTLDWTEIRDMFEHDLKKGEKVLSFKIGYEGITVYLELPNGMTPSSGDWPTKTQDRRYGVKWRMKKND